VNESAFALFQGDMDPVRLHSVDFANRRRNILCELCARCAKNSGMRFVLLVAGFTIALFLAGCAQSPAELSRNPVREKVEERPQASTPTPTPQAPIYLPLDPTGQPQ
jgi:hypothetical protein